jgi:hypothetical protein
MQTQPANISTKTDTGLPGGQVLALSGSWTARTMGSIGTQLAAVHARPGAGAGADSGSGANRLPDEKSRENPQGTADMRADGTQIDALDTAGAWVMQTLLLRLREEGPAR